VERRDVHADGRGFFLETYHADRYRECGIAGPFVQDNHSRSVSGTLRGLHLQVGRAQGKLIRVIEGEIFDVAVDVRRGSPTFGKWVGVELSAENKRQLWVPPGFGHAFLVRSEYADFLYKTTEYWLAEYERSLRWDDPVVDVNWGLGSQAPALAAKDANAPLLSSADIDGCLSAG